MKPIKFLFFCLIFFFVACGGEDAPIPKPRGFMHIDFPEKNYKAYHSTCSYNFEHPTYSNVENTNAMGSDTCNKNINFNSFNSTLHLTYKSLNNDLAKFIEDCHNMVYQHSVKAYDISAKQFMNSDHRVYGLLYDIKGNAASPLQFYLTDSSQHFIRGALYFNVKPNYDSIQPALQFLREDVMHFVESLEWKD